MGLIKFVFGGLLAIVGFGFMVMTIIGLPFLAMATNSFWVIVVFAAIGLVIGLIGIYLMRSG